VIHFSGREKEAHTRTRTHTHTLTPHTQRSSILSIDKQNKTWRCGGYYRNKTK